MNKQKWLNVEFRVMFNMPVDEDFDLQPETTGEINLNETQTFKLNISE